MLCVILSYLSVHMHLVSCSFHVWCILICYNILLSWRVSHVVQVFSTRVTKYILMFERFQFNFSKYRILKSFTGWISKCYSMTFCVCKGIQKINKEVLKKIFESVRRFIYTKDPKQVQGWGFWLYFFGVTFESHN